MLAPDPTSALKLGHKWQPPFSAAHGHVKYQICFGGSWVKRNTINNLQCLWDDEEGFYCLHQQQF